MIDDEVKRFLSRAKGAAAEARVIPLDELRRSTPEAWGLVALRGRLRELSARRAAATPSPCACSRTSAAAPASSTHCGSKVRRGTELPAVAAQLVAVTDRAEVVLAILLESHREQLVPLADLVGPVAERHVQKDGV